MNTRLGRVAGCLALAIATARCADKIAPPTANAGTSVTADMGSSVSLDGRSSTDPQGRSLAYDWSFATRPAASRASFNDAHIATPSFVPDLDGQYVISLVVSNGVLSSAPSQVTVTVRKCGQAEPQITAAAATPASPNIGASVQLSATVHDADNDQTCNLNQTFTLLWAPVSRPGSSRTALSDPAATSPTIVPDAVGTYQFSVVATDSTGLQSAPKFVTFTTSACGAAAVTFNTPAITAAFAENAPNVGAAMTLTAHPIDPNVACGVPAGPVQYTWTLAGPSGSTAVAFATQAGTQFTFTPDVVGTYDVSVRAVDAQGHSSDASTSISTTTCGAVPIAVQVAPGSSTVNSYESLTLTATPAATTCPARFAPQFAWAFAGVGAPAQLSSSSGTSVNFRGTGPGDYVVSAVAINTSGHEGPVATASVHVNACGSRAPVIATTSNSPTFPARLQTVTLSATAVDPDASCGAARSSTIAFELLSIPQGSTLTFPAGANSFQADVEGTYSFRVVATEDGTGLRSDTAVLNVTVLDPDPAASTLAAVPTSGAAFVVADNVDSATVTVSLRNRLGQPVGSLPVSVAASGSANTFNPLSASGSTNAGGVFTVTLTSTKAETKTFTATANPVLAAVVLNNHPSVSFVAGPTASISLTGLPASVTAGVASTVTVTAFDQFGNVAKGPNAYTGTIHFTSTDPHPATLPADFTFAGTDNGTHTFTNGVALFTASSQTVTVTDTVRATLTSSQTTTVNSAVAASITLAGTPASVTAGVAFTVSVTAHDAFGNVAKGPNAYTGTVHLSSTDPFPATLPTNFTFAPTDNGTHTFTNGVTLFTAGSQTVTVTDTVNATFTSSQTTTVNSAAAASIALAGTPASVTAGVAFTVSVTAHDAFGNVAKGPKAYTGTVHFTSTDPFPATLPANFTFAATDNGTHTFNNALTLFTAGSRTVTVTDTVSATFTSSQTTTVTAAAAASLAVTGLPSPFPAGTSQPFTVTAFDAFGNIATGYTGTVAFTSSDAAAAFTPANHTFTTGTAQDNGVFVAHVTLTTAGPQTVTAKDAVNALTAVQGTTVSGLAFATRAGTNPPNVVGSTSASAVATFSDGSFVATGTFSGSATWGATTRTATGSSDLYVARFNKDGTLAWVQTAGTAGQTVAGSGVAACDASGCGAGSAVVAGTFTGAVTFGATTLTAATGATELFLVRYNAAGAVVSAKQTQGTPSPSASSVTVGGLAGFADGSAVATGSYVGGVTFGPGEVASANHAGATLLSTGGFFLARFNTDGTLFSATSVTTGNVTGLGVAAVSFDGGAIAVGTFTADTTFGTKALTHSGAAGAKNGFVVKYASDGTVTWAAGIGGATPATASVTAAAAFTNGDVVATGSFTNTVAFGPGASPPGATAAGNPDAFVARLKGSDGTAVWVKQAGSVGGGGSGFGVATFGVDGSVAVVGAFNATTTFAFGTTILSSAGGNDVFVARYSGTGTLTSAVAAGGAGDELASAVAGFADTGAIVAGKLNETTQATPAVSTFGANVLAQKVLLTTQAGAQDAFYAKYYPY